MNTWNDRTMDVLPEASVLLIALLLDGYLSSEGNPAPPNVDDPHDVHMSWFGTICYN